MHPSVWLDAPLPDFPPLAQDAACDVCVVGGGIAGLLTAEALARRGKSVVVLEQHAFASGETGHTTAHFASALDDRFAHLERLHGQRGMTLAAQSHAAAIDHVENLVHRLGIECFWRRVDGYLVVNERHAGRRDELLNEELVAATLAGLKVDRVSQVPAPWPQGGGPALRFARQAQAHPLLLMRGVARHLVDRVRLHAHTHVTRVHGGTSARVETSSGRTVACEHVVVATNTPINNLVAVHTKQSGYQTYAIAMEVPEGSLPALLWWDGNWEDDEWYHYVRTSPWREGRELLIVGGEDHRTGQGPQGDPFTRLELWARDRFPMADALVRSWSGEVMEPTDGLAYIGHNAVDRPNVHIVTGDSGNGMTHAGVAAMLIPTLIAGEHSPWATLYDPARKVGFKSFGEYFRENFNTLAQYGDWLKAGDVKDASEVGRGQGAIVREGLRHVAVYCDDTGKVTRLSAVCPHLAGVVRWNAQEQTWDCPCHSSRFDRFGKVIHGPANTDLTPL